MVEARLPAQLEVASLIRRTQVEGGFAVVVNRGEAEAGTILVILTENGANTRLYERMPQADGSRQWHCAKWQDVDNPEEFTKYLERRKSHDGDLWIVELDIVNGERLIGLPPVVG